MAIVAALIICAGIPKRYTSQVKISDEHFETDLLIGLNNMAAWAKGAINEHKGLRMPQVYYRLIGSPSFIEEMSQVRLENKGTDSEIKWTVEPPVELPFQIKNTQGTELPSTGGMGTKILYTIGGLMVVAGGVFLAAKKRMSTIEE